MLKKLLILPILFLSLCILNAQQLPLSSNDGTAKKTNLTFKETTKSYENYFATKDIDKKGSGYKPFKRWEYHWSHYLQPDGTIAPVEHLWKAWEKKQQMTKSTNAVSNWTPKGPFSTSTVRGQGRVNTVVVDPNNANTIYVGAPAGGLWKSTDAGVNWTPLTDDLPQIGVSGIAIDPNNSQIIYISTGDDDAGDSYSIGVLKSTDGGATWNQTGTIAGNPISSNEIVIDPSNSNRIWVATGSGLFLSTNGGTSWTAKISFFIRDFKLKPGDPNTIYAVSSNQFLVSINGGNSFVSATGIPSATALGRLRVEVTPAAPNNVYILAAKPTSQNWAFEGVYKSTNSGTSFSKTAENSDIFGGSTQAWYDLAFSVSPIDENTMYVGVLDIWKSTDEGNNFTQINAWNQITPTYTHADIHFMRYYGNVLYAGTDGGIYKSTNNGSTFTDLTENLSISQFYKVTVSKQSSDKLAGGLQDNGGFAYSNNSWNPYHGGDGMDSASDPNDENTFYGFTQFGGNLTVTNDGGVTSAFVASSPSSGNWVTPLVANKGSELYSGFNQLYKLITGGWVQISSHSFGGNLETIEIDPSNNDIIYASRGRTLYKSIDKGVTFTTFPFTQTGLLGSNVSSIEVHNTDSNIVWVTTAGTNPQFPSSGHTGGGVYKSVDGGQTFTNITDNLPNESKLVVRHHIYSPNNSIYVGTALGVYYRDDATNTWEVFSTNLPNVAVTDLEINPYDDTITAATYGRSVWQSSITATAFPSVEIDFLKISSPNNSVSCGEISPKLSVLNNGTNTVTSLTVNYSIDGGANQVFNWTGSIASNISAIINLPTTSSLAEGEHTLTASLVLANDANLSNNSANSTFSVNQIGVGQYINTFGDVNPDVWLADSLWEIGSPSTADFNNIVTSGYATDLTKNYPDNTTAYLYSPCYNLALLENPVLKFKMAFDIEPDWDVLYMEYSLDQGVTWQVLGTATDPNWYNSSFIDPNRVLTIGKQWTGTDTTLKEYSYDLAALTNESNIIFRFKFASDQAVNEEGVVIDDFVIDASAILAVNDFDKDAFSIYPNPSSDIFNIRRINGNGEEMKLQIFDVTGKLIRIHNNITDNNYELDMIGVTKGVYFMRISIDNKQLVKKLILK